MRPPTLPPGSKGAQRRELAGTRRPLQGTPPHPPALSAPEELHTEPAFGWGRFLGFLWRFRPFVSFSLFPSG